MTDRARAGVATHYLRYVFGNILIMVAGFVSFPVMTRLLDVGQYGIFGYYDAWLLILAAVFKLGAQHTILRFYPHTGGPAALAEFGASQILVPFLASTESTARSVSSRRVWVGITTLNCTGGDIGVRLAGQVCGVNCAIVDSCQFSRFEGRDGVTNLNRRARLRFHACPGLARPVYS